MNEELIATAEMGDAAKKFAESELGQCLLGMAEQDVLLAQGDLIDIDPDDTKKIRDTQNRAKLALSFKQWLFELIDKGEAALEIFRQERD